MKALFRAVGLFSLLVFVACHGPQREARHLMVRAEQLLDTMPDSTFCLIDSVLRMDAYLSERSRMEMALLQGEALFRHVSLDDEDIDSVLGRFSPSPELERAAAYFAEKKDYAQASHAALYSGYVQQYFHDKTTAMQSYKEAEQYGTLAEEDLVVAKARCKMGKMMYGEYLHEEALSLFKQAESGLVDRDEDLSLLKNMMAVTYINLQQFDSAEICLKQSCDIAKQSQCGKAKMKALNNYAVLHRLQGNYSQALECLRQQGMSSDSASVFLSCLNIGKVFAVSGEVDSASYYFHRLDDLLPLVDINMETKSSAYLAMAYFSESQGDLQKALQYHKKQELLLGDLFDKSKERTALGVQRKYNFEALQNVMTQKIIRRHRIIIAVSLLAVLGFAALALVQIHLAKARKEEADAKTNLFHFMQQNRELCEMNEQKDKAMVDYAERFSESLKKEALTMCKLDIYLENRGDVACLKALEEAVFGHEDHWEALMAVFDTLYPGVRENLALQYPELTEMEQKIFILSYFNASREDEALMFGKSVHLVDKWRSGIKKKTQERVRNV